MAVLIQRLNAGGLLLRTAFVEHMPALAGEFLFRKLLC